MKAQKRDGHPPSLYTDPNAEVCTQFAVFRHPAYRWLKYFCYLGMPAIFMLALIVGQGMGAILALAGFLVFMLLVIVSLVAAEQHARLAAAFRAAQRLKNGWQFVCPGCLQVGPVRHACGVCKEELEPFVILTRGWYLNDCAHCHSRVFNRWWKRGNRPNAFCRDCDHLADTRHHRRRVRVMAVLSSLDLETLHAAVASDWAHTPEGSYLYRDMGQVMHYAIDLGSTEGDVLPARHAGRRLTSVWLDAALGDPLRLGEALDRLIRKADLGDARRREVELCIPHPALPPAARNIVEARFTRVRCGISAAAFFTGSTETPCESTALGTNAPLQPRESATEHSKPLRTGS